MQPLETRPPLHRFGTEAANDAGASPSEQQSLRAACHALWTASLALVSAYAGDPDTARRRTIARHLTTNFATLAREAPTFAPGERRRLLALAAHWARIEVQLGPPAAPSTPRFRPAAPPHGGQPSHV